MISISLRNNTKGLLIIERWVSKKSYIVVKSFLRERSEENLNLERTIEDMFSLNLKNIYRHRTFQ